MNSLNGQLVWLMIGGSRMKIFKNMTGYTIILIGKNKKNDQHICPDLYVVTVQSEKELREKFGDTPISNMVNGGVVCGLPVPDEHFNYIVSYDVVAHLLEPRKDIFVMNPDDLIHVNNTDHYLIGRSLTPVTQELIERIRSAKKEMAEIIDRSRTI